MLIQHYLAEKAAPDQVVMHSKNTRVYVMHVFPATIEVIWTLGIKPSDSNSAEFSCSVEALMPAPLGSIATLGLPPLFLRWHVEEEAIKFAADIARKIGARAVGFEWQSQTLPGVPNRDLLAALLVNREQDFLRFVDPCCEVC